MYGQEEQDYGRVTQEDLNQAMNEMVRERAMGIATQRQENEASGVIAGQDKYSISNGNINSAVTALVEGLAQSENSETRAYGIKLANHLSKNYGSVNAITNDSSLVSEILEQASMYVDPNDRYLVGTLEALHSTGQDMGMDGDQHRQAWDDNRSFTNEPNRPEHEMVRSNVDGANYYRTENGLIPQDVYENHSVAVDALPFDGENQGEYSGLTDK